MVLTDTDRINAILDCINDYTDGQDWDSLDRFVREFPLSATILELLALMRSSYAVRDHLPSWSAKLEEIRASEDYMDQLLHGLSYSD